LASDKGVCFFFTFPVFTPFLGFLLFKERLRPIPVIAAMVGFFGCAMIIGGYQIKGLPGETFGIILGLVSGTAYALYTLLGQKVTALLEPT
jgi:drug/metabolite transporter (DMT)-like permease